VTRYRVVEVLNVATVAGSLVATAVFFGADRVLPVPSLIGRSGKCDVSLSSGAAVLHIAFCEGGPSSPGRINCTKLHFYWYYCPC
jgi:hypothetical protein